MKKNKKEKKEKKQKENEVENNSSSSVNSDVDDYTVLLTDNCSCFVSFKGNSQDNVNATILDVDRIKTMVTWQDEEGAWRYSSTDCKMSSPDFPDYTFFFKQEKNGEFCYYQIDQSHPDECSLLCKTKTSKFAPIDPMIAFILDNYLYVVFNRPTKEALDKGLLMRLPMINNGIVKASGMMLISQVDLFTGEHHVLFFTKKDMISYFSTLIVNTQTHLPGLLIFHPLTDEKTETNQSPESFLEFSEFIANKEPVDKLSQEFSIPSGIIVFDFSDFTFGPVPLTGDDTWGIEEIIIDDQPDTDKITFGIIENGHKELSEHLPENTTVVERVDEMEVTEIDDNDCRVIDIERDTIVEEKQ